MEPHHADGSTSILHLGIGTAGRRDLVCDQVSAAPQVVLKNVPGTVYLGQLTGPEHQVFHQPCPDDELIDATGFGPTSCTLMCRTALFPHDRSRRMNGFVHTPELFTVLQQAFAAGLRQNDFRLPTLAECLEAEGQLHLTLPAWPKGVHRKPAALKRSALQRPVLPHKSPVQRFMRKKASAAKVVARGVPSRPQQSPLLRLARKKAAAAKPVAQVAPTRRMKGKAPFPGVFVDKGSGGSTRSKPFRVRHGICSVVRVVD